MSIQHDLKIDNPFLTTGNLFDRRKALWGRGARNILFVVNEQQKIEPELDLSKVILIGHSNGGDMPMMMA